MRKRNSLSDAVNVVSRVSDCRVHGLRRLKVQGRNRVLAVQSSV